jgi:DNA uptake protein ComE-like DNA-binding protein
MTVSSAASKPPQPAHAGAWLALAGSTSARAALAGAWQALRGGTGAQLALGGGRPPVASARPTLRGARRALAGLCLALGTLAAMAAPVRLAAAAPSQEGASGGDAAPRQGVSTAPAVPVDLNVASAQELAALPGVGISGARKIIAARPYGSVADLTRSGLPARTIERITPLVTVAGHPASAGSTTPAPAAGPAGTASSLRGAAGPRTGRTREQNAALTPPPPTPKVDLNNATEKQLLTLPGVDGAMARRILAARPYSMVEDLTRAGLPAAVIARLAPYATAGPKPPPPTPAAMPVTGAGVPASAGPPLPPASSAPPASTLAAPAGTPSAPGMVWANPDSKLYYFPGERWYGKTRHGKYLTEADAIKAGYRAARPAPRQPPK